METMKDLTDAEMVTLVRAELNWLWKRDRPLEDQQYSLQRLEEIVNGPDWWAKREQREREALEAKG